MRRSTQEIVRMANSFWLDRGDILTMRLTVHLCIAVLLLLGGTRAHAALSADEAMNQLVTRLTAELSPQELSQLDDAAVLSRVTADEREALATRHHYFRVNVPVVVSVMRETGQAVPPFWLEERGFKKTELVVTNTENWTYEVWQKAFPVGEIGLGINGFDRHRPHYFVSVGAQDPGVHVEVSDRFPAEHALNSMHEGAFVYHDWDSLLLKDVPEELVGQPMLATIRGRAREAHLLGGFRETPTPSSSMPDQILLTWSDDPRTTQAIQWRTNTEIAAGEVKLWKVSSPDKSRMITADLERIEDRFLLNDRHCHRFSARLEGLMPGTEYGYQVGSVEEDIWSEPLTFTTAPSKPKPFTFITFGDTHVKPVWGDMLRSANVRHPEAAFYLIAGDLVDTGQYRDDWDRFFALSSEVFSRRPLIPTIGNHDSIDGLGAGMYRSMFTLPENGSTHLPAEQTFTVTYGNVLFIVLDTSSRTMDQAEWLEEMLAASKEDWKIAMFHFPPYNAEQAYPDIENLWGYLFDKYHVDIALQGHFHYYMRSHPIRRGQPVIDPAEGTIHLMSIAIENRERNLPDAPYAAVQFGGIPLYQTFEVDGRRLTVRAHDPAGKVRDEFTLTK